LNGTAWCRLYTGPWGSDSRRGLDIGPRGNIHARRTARAWGSTYATANPYSTTTDASATSDAGSNSTTATAATTTAPLSRSIEWYHYGKQQRSCDMPITFHCKSPFERIENCWLAQHGAQLCVDTWQTVSRCKLLVMNRHLRIACQRGGRLESERRKSPSLSVFSLKRRDIKAEVPSISEVSGDKTREYSPWMPNRRIDPGQRARSAITKR